MRGLTFLGGLFGPRRPAIDRDDPRVRRRLQKEMPLLDEMQMEPLPKIPGMICEREQRYLYWLTSQAYSGQGAVAELGSFLGKSAMYLGAGLRKAGFDIPLWCFDKFEWAAAASWSERYGIALPDKADFRPLFLEHVRPIYPPVRAVKTDIKRIEWKGGLVEILFLDAPKRLAEISAVLTNFGPYLEPHFSLIVCDDYNHVPSFELAASLSQLGRKLELIHALPDSSTVSFMLRARLSRAETTPKALSFQNWSLAQAKERWASLLGPLPTSSREQLELGLAMLLHDLGHVEEAIKLVQETEISPTMLERWRRWTVMPSLYARYAPVFDAVAARAAR